MYLWNEFSKFDLLKSFIYPCFVYSCFFKTRWNKFQWGTIYACACTHTCEHTHTRTHLNINTHIHTWTCKQHSHHAHKTEQERKFRYNAKHLRRNISNIGSLKEKSNLGLGVGKKFITSKAKRIQHLSKFPWLQGQSQEGKTRVTSGAVKFVFPSSNVSAHWSLNLSHSLLKQMPQSVTDTALLIKCTRRAFSGRLFFQIK